MIPCPNCGCMVGPAPRVEQFSLAMLGIANGAAAVPSYEKFTLTAVGAAVANPAPLPILIRCHL